MQRFKQITLWLSLAFFVSSMAASAQTPQRKNLSIGQLNKYGSQVVVLKIEKKIGHRLDWKRRQQLRDKAAIMYDTIDRSNQKFAQEIQKAFHLSQGESTGLNSRQFERRLYGSSDLIKGRIARLRKKPLTKYESTEIDRLVRERDRVQKSAREKMAYEINGTIGISYPESLALLQPNKSRSLRGSKRSGN